MQADRNFIEAYFVLKFLKKTNDRDSGLALAATFIAHGDGVFLGDLLGVFHIGTGGFLMVF